MTRWSDHFTVERCPSLEAAARKSLELISGQRIALSGGSTYAALFPHWVKPLKGKNFEFFPVDERRVPMEHAASNWGSAKRLLFDPLGDKVSPLNFAASGPVFSRLLAEKFKAPLPVFDTVYLGAGTDGHTASLFPGNAYLGDTTTPVLETESPLPPVNRITLGPEVLRIAKQLVVVLWGAEKEAIFRALMTGKPLFPIVQMVWQRKNTSVIVPETYSATTSAM